MKNEKEGKKRELTFDQTEKDVTKIWAEVLQYEQVGLEDNFYEKGGDSIMLMMVLFRINEKFDLNLMPGDMAVSPTLIDMCKLIDRNLYETKGPGLTDEMRSLSNSGETGVV